MDGSQWTRLALRAYEFWNGASLRESQDAPRTRRRSDALREGPERGARIWPWVTMEHTLGVSRCIAR